MRPAVPTFQDYQGLLNSLRIFKLLPLYIPLQLNVTTNRVQLRAAGEDDLNRDHASNQRVHGLREDSLVAHAALRPDDTR